MDKKTEITNDFYIKALLNKIVLAHIVKILPEFKKIELNTITHLIDISNDAKSNLMNKNRMHITLHSICNQTKSDITINVIENETVFTLQQSMMQVIGTIANMTSKELCQTKKVYSITIYKNSILSKNNEITMYDVKKKHMAGPIFDTNEDKLEVMIISLNQNAKNKCSLTELLNLIFTKDIDDAKKVINLMNEFNVHIK